MANETQVEETAAQVEDPNALQATDLNTMATVLEAVAQRGAVRANEMQVVGALYNKLMGFLIANGIRQAPGAEAPGAEAPEAEHTHEDGTSHAHEGGEVEHSHDEGEADNA